MILLSFYSFFFLCYGAHRELTVHTPAFPTTMSSDIADRKRGWVWPQCWGDGTWVCRTGEQEEDARGRARTSRIGKASILRVGLNGRRSIPLVRAADEMLKEGRLFPARLPVELMRLAG